MKARLVACGLVTLVAACGGETQTAPPPPTVAPPPATTASAATTTATQAAAPTPKPAIGDLEKKTLADQWAAMNAHDLKAAMAAYTADAVLAAPGPGGIKEVSLEQFRASHEQLFAAFPDIKIGATRVLAKGNTVAYEWVVTGTNTGDFMGDKATGKKIGVMGASLVVFSDDGKIKRETNYIDNATIAQQLGKMPGKPRAMAELPKGEPTWLFAKGDDTEAKVVEALKTKLWPATFAKDAKAYEATLDEQSAHYEIAGPNDFVGKKACMAESEMYQKALADVSTTVDDAWAVGNVVVVQFTFAAGSMKGPIGPFKATKKPITIHGLDFDEVNAGPKMGKAYTYSNGTELLDELDVLPKPKAKADAKASKVDDKAAKPDAKAPKADKPKP